MSESMQKDFEEWWEGRGLPENAKAAFYMVWKASRAALCVELPKIVNSEWACTADECAAMRDAIRFCKQAIHASGVKTK